MQTSRFASQQRFPHTTKVTRGQKYVCVYQSLKQPSTSGPILSRQRNSRPMPPLRGNEHDFQTSKKGILGWPQERAQEPTTLVRHLFLPTPVTLLQTLSPLRRSGWPQLTTLHFDLSVYEGRPHCMANKPNALEKNSGGAGPRVFWDFRGLKRPWSRTQKGALYNSFSNSSFESRMHWYTSLDQASHVTSDIPKVRFPLALAGPKDGRLRLLEAQVFWKPNVVQGGFT